MARRKKSPESTSRRSVTHATDSTRSGCSENVRAATSAPTLTRMRSEVSRSGSDRRRSFEASA